MKKYIMKTAIHTSVAVLFFSFLFSATGTSATISNGSFYYMSNQSIAPNKSGLGPDAVASADHFTNNQIGITGVKLNFELSASETLNNLTINDFDFHFGNINNAGRWSPLSLTGATLNTNSNEATITWESPIVKDGWLEIKYSTDQYLYFGNLIGDANLDGVLTSLDALEVTNYLNTGNPVYAYQYDINGDGNNSSADVLVIEDRLNSYYNGLSIAAGPFIHTLVFANAGPDQYVNEGTPVTLDASESTGEIISYEWMQTGGPTVTPSPSWFVKNPSGKNISSGFYLYKIKDQNGNLDAEGTVIIIR